MALKRLALFVAPPYREDRVFDPSSPLNRDNCLSAFRLLQTKMSDLGWECHTQDVYSSGGVVPDAVLFNEFPRGGVERSLGSWAGKTSAYAVLLECEVIRPDNWLPGSHGSFKAVFTWDRKYVDGKRYYKVNFPNAFRAAGPEPAPERDIFCAAISAHKKRSHPLELYTERERAIRWFEENHPSDFSLYGMGWDRHSFDEAGPCRIFNRFGRLTRALGGKFPSYRGKVAEKRSVFKRTRFALCYENARGIPGYITEKIFDCLMAGCIPVYLGAPDIKEAVPEDCFIDRRDFADHEALYRYMTGLTEKELARKRDAARDYLLTPRAHPFSDRYFAETISEVVVNA